MIRNLKVLGLALVAIFAMSAMVASAASASVFEVEGGNAESTTKIEGGDVGSVTLTVTGTTITCSEVSYSAHVIGASVESVTADPPTKGAKPVSGPKPR